MSKELTTASENELPQLSPKQVQTLMAMLSSSSDAEAIKKCPYSEAQFYRYKPLLMKYKEHYLNQSLQQSVDMLKALSPRAVYELGEELNHRDTRIKNKAANDILDRAIPKRPDVAVQVNNYQVSEEQLDRLS